LTRSSNPSALKNPGADDSAPAGARHQRRDTAALKPDGLQRTVLILAITKPARLYISDAILAEYREVLARPELKIRKGLRQQLLQLIRSHAHRVAPSRPIHVAKDPDDDKFLECADAARADYLVTGNQRHFPKFWKKTKVITSREFITIVAPHMIT
jgi:putative PIN family toxin of toxin-antitoxin system